MSVNNYWEKMLPTQPDNRKLFDGETNDLYLNLFNTILISSSLDLPSNEFDLSVSNKVNPAEMGSNPITLRFIQFLLSISKARSVLEIGTFIGLSTMAFAKALPDDGKVVTIEKFNQFAEIARDNFAKNSISKKIDLIVGDALEKIDAFNPSDRFDMIFIDGNKENYDQYFLRLEKYLNSGGFFIVDDCFFHCDALNASPKTAKGQGVKNFLDLAAGRSDYLKIALPIANGVYLMKKNKN